MLLVITSGFAHGVGPGHATLCERLSFYFIGFAGDRLFVVYFD